MRSIGKAILGIGLAATISACGSEEPVKAMGQPMAETTGAAAPTEGNLPPVIEQVVLRPTSPRPGERVTAEVTATDPDGDRVRLSYQWVVGNEHIDAGASLHVGSVDKGTPIRVRVTPEDGQTTGSPQTASATVGNQPPVLLGIAIEPRGTVTVEHDLQAVPHATDADGDDLDYAFNWRVNGRPVDGAQALLSRSEFRRGDEITLSVLATDGAEESTPIQSQPMAVGNAPPRIVSAPGDFGADGSFTYPVVVEDPDGDRRFRYRLIDAPEGMRVDFISGLLTWKPIASDTGDHRVVVEVDDLNGGTVTQDFSVNVAFEAAAPPAARAN